MNALGLRQLTSTEQAWQQAQKGWQAQGIEVSFGLPDVDACHVFSVDGGRWQGLLSLHEWLSCVSPALAEILGSTGDDGQLQALFMATPRPLEFAATELAYDSLQLGQKSQIPASAMLCLKTPQGRVWLTDIPAVMKGQDKLDPAWLLTLPVQLIFEIGCSKLSQRAKARLGVGDVLLISEETHWVKSCDVRIGRYWQNEDGIMIEREDEAHLATPTEIPDLLAELPLRLEFILQQSTVSLSELGDLYLGQLLPLLPDAEKQIEVKTNGVLIARGELVLVDGRLGVELLEIQQEVLHVE
ncbi:FliM/FliN family flagellar motor switch protein [Iodobacter fluviatilis]|uniref:Surface presentation of antigens protein SpaO n=1 Tax=Iodobacter fluviatilis TaxID=537 RepID=A0A377Q5M0_9NEIS|nr:FliM/FliN family flagellar motor switch protein [Iodobacter fluviatilis]TCU86892.1 type III secretion system apparatus protein YscQ/HrcQ [Iodobacter fluviatilis]STQ90223.1 type III secretion system protein SpaO [Iodobacter fluviatilis]